MAKKKTKAYKVLSDTSVRVSADPADPDEWLHYPAGTVVTDWPAHADVEGWVASGHWEPVEDVPEAED